MYAGKFRRVPRPDYRRERIETPDSDFIDLDLIDNHSDRIAILLHGLEGSADRPYMRGMTQALSAAGWNICAVNFRGCSGQTNRLASSYHSGATYDLITILNHIGDQYRHTSAVGFSLGGNLMLKYLGETPEQNGIDAAVAISVPCDLKASSNQLAQTQNRPYMYNFLRSLRGKIEEKARLFPDQVSMDGYSSIRTFQDFDDQYTAPLHGFRDAEHYWAQCSSRQFLTSISVPTLMISALDDPFLPERCYPEDEAKQSNNLFLEAPQYGGHVGFFDREMYWTERRAVEFLGACAS